MIRVRCLCGTFSILISHRRPNGITVTVPTEDVLIPKPTIGDIVTFSFDANARRDVPTNPKIFRVRSDVVWDDLVRNSRMDKQRVDGMLRNPKQRKRSPYVVLGSNVFTTKPQGYWTSKNMRAYMENFAKRRHMDPLLPETWLHSFSEFVQSKVGDLQHKKRSKKQVISHLLQNSRAILGKFKSGYLQALLHLFPEVTFDPSAFQQGIQKQFEYFI